MSTHPELGLKFVVHAGDVVTQRVAGRTELAGVAAIVAHRLLKADTPSNLGLERYALLTDACVHRLGLDPAALGLVAGTETFDYLGDVAVWLRDHLAGIRRHRVDLDATPVDGPSWKPNCVCRWRR
jgi:hypothetical protein